MRYSIIGENRYEWGSLLSLRTEAALLPLDKYLPENEVEALIERGKVDVIFYSPAFHDMMFQYQKNKRLKYYICMEQLENSATQDFELARTFPKAKN